MFTEGMYSIIICIYMHVFSINNYYVERCEIKDLHADLCSLVPPDSPHIVYSIDL